MRVLSTPGWPPSGPSCRSDSTSSCRLWGTKTWTTALLPSADWNCLQSTLSHTVNWSQIYRSLRVALLTLFPSIVGFLSASFPLKKISSIGSANCSARMFCTPGIAGLCKEVTAIWGQSSTILSLWRSLPNCWHGVCDNTSALMCFLPLLWTISKSSSCSFSSQHADCPSEWL